MTEEDARGAVAALVSGEGLELLDRLADLVLAESEHQNLIAGSTKAWIWTRHMLDSIQLLKLVEEDWRQWLDIGSGGGFPGLALACVDQRPMVLVEPRGLRARFLQRAVDELGLNHVEVYQQRVERLGLSSDVISARAVAPPDKLLQLARQCATSETVWLLPRGRHGEDDVVELAQRNGNMTFHVEQSRSDPASAIIVGRGKPR